MTDHEPELTPPSAARVARRALVLAAVVCRSSLEGDAGDAEAEEFRKSLIPWLERFDLLSEVEPDERLLLSAPLGAATDRQVIDGTWRVEGLAVLAWALGHYDLPAYDTESDGPAAATALGFLTESSDTVLTSPQLRPAPELTELADELFALHWRLRQFSSNNSAMDFAQFARTAWFGPLRIANLRLIEGDLDLQGMPLPKAPETLWRTATSIARERQQAANWLMGQDVLYSEVTCDT